MATAAIEAAKKAAKEKERELEKQRELEELQAAAERVAALEREKRVPMLLKSMEIIYSYDQWVFGHVSKQKEEYEWKAFRSCRNIPNFSKISEVSSYMSWWEKQLKADLSLKRLLQLTPEYLRLLTELKEFLILPPDNVRVDLLKNLGILYRNMGKNQIEYLDTATFEMMADLSPFYDIEEGLLGHSLSIPLLTICFWGNVYLSPGHASHAFPETKENFTFNIPDALQETKGIYRLVKMEFDIFSDATLSFFPPNVESFLKQSLIDWIGPQKSEKTEKAEKIILKKFRKKLRRVRKRKPPKIEEPKTEEILKEVEEEKVEKAEDKEITEEPVKIEEELKKEEPQIKEVKKPEEDPLVSVQESLKEDEAAPSETSSESGSTKSEEGKSQSETKEKTPEESAEKVDAEKKTEKPKGKKLKKKESIPQQKSAAELAKERERAEKAQFIPPLKEGELNLRNYQILGGVYDFNLIQIPAQPEKKGKWRLQNAAESPQLQFVPFKAAYIPPPPLSEHDTKKSPEQMEREAKEQEEEMKKLVLLEMTVPKAALWFEPPIPVRWDNENNYWSKEDFYDVKFNEWALHLTFRTARFGVFAFGHNRWSNLPYQSWEIRPLGKDKVSFGLVAAIAVVDFIAHGENVAVTGIGNVGNSGEVEAALLNKYMKPKDLIKEMRHHGLDIFPEFDSYAYVDGVLLKHIDAEDHLYQCVALVSGAFNFQWSRWNMLAGREKMVYQIRERHGEASPGNFAMALTTPKKTIRVDCTEVSPNYSEMPVEEGEYFPDLINLVDEIVTEPGREIIMQTSPHHIEALRILLTASLNTCNEDMRRTPISWDTPPNHSVSLAQSDQPIRVSWWSGPYIH